MQSMYQFEMFPLFTDPNNINHIWIEVQHNEIKDFMEPQFFLEL